MKLSIALFLSATIAASNAAKARGGRGEKNQTTRTRQLKGGGGKGGGDIFKRGVEDYEEPPAGVLPGDIITDCSIKLTDNLDCRGAFDCLTLDATDDDVELDCDGYTIGNYNHDNNGIDLKGCGPHTITIKNCYVTGFEDCIDAGPNAAECCDYNAIIENTAVIGCKNEGMDL
jgi:hypothetical protein